ncbi:metal-sensitive transcriptional regulator [Enterococcus sp. BWB1-3]|uniref:metal-sensitive transcriptional regulator n=1 Tax=unclassified Enterococcus TaxID=2608891 RepID=UPI00192469DF|nr:MULTISPECIES: metal-sensitive transcriptional regulator [unclassified Enterococcus]MBL1229058.1 metal-sensitive transcriptional regulator [Enterococcus sp. BWB1-3]MCB5953085.1 metal-sensitive transcriptional regulator [Enterococcus sp. BWT-B8]MCB5955445.1 metal-sensitive transcriptional regulator [Enterococcus sp. CWB-B31]
MECDKKIANRLKRSEGQVRGILKMMEEGKDCREVVTQLMAVRSSIDKVIGLVVTENLVQCMQEKDIDLTSEDVEKALEMIIKTR